MKKFKLSTQGHSYGKVKGWNWTCPLYQTVRNHRPEDRVDLASEIEKEIFSAREKLAVFSLECRGVTREQAKRRQVRNAIARYTRTFDKIQTLKRALEVLKSDNPNKI